MKKLITKIVLLVLLAMVTGMTRLYAQQIIVYFHAPTATLTTNFTGATAPYIQPTNCANGSNYGFSHVVLDNQTAPIFRTLMTGTKIRQTYDSLMDANSVLRRRLMQIRGLSNNLVNTIDINLFDDRAGIPAGGPCQCPATLSGKNAVWPCASNYRHAGVYTGFAFLGELAANHIINKADGGGWWEWYETVVHEFSHTQFATEYDASGNSVANKWGQFGLSISYGGDKGHWGNELQADPQSALDEGLATFWGLDRNAAGRTNLINWLNDNTPRLALGSHSFLTGIPLMWDQPHTVLVNAEVPANRVITLASGGTITLVSPSIQTGARYELRSYRWLDVPGKFVFYNEQMFQAFALSFFENALPSRTQAFNMMLDAAKAMTPPNNRLRYPAHMANGLANGLEAFARTPEGRAAETSHTLVSSMFAYALMDIVTHFGMSEADLRREFTINMSTYNSTTQPLAFNAYWAHRAAIKAIACPNLGGADCTGTGTIDFMRAVRDVKNYCTDSSRILR
jgi:hypothetical protein